MQKSRMMICSATPTSFNERLADELKSRFTEEITIEERRSRGNVYQLLQATDPTRYFAIAVLEQQQSSIGINTPKDIEELRLTYPEIPVIFFIDKSHQGDAFVRELFAQAYYQAIYWSGREDAVASFFDILEHPRSEAEARDYYGLSVKTTSEIILSDDAVNKTLSYLLSAKTDAEIIERYIYNYKKSSPAEREYFAKQIRDTRLLHALDTCGEYRMFVPRKEERRGIFGRKKQEPPALIYYAKEDETPAEPTSSQLHLEDLLEDLPSSSLQTAMSNNLQTASSNQPPGKEMTFREDSVAEPCVSSTPDMSGNLVPDEEELPSPVAPDSSAAEPTQPSLVMAEEDEAFTETMVEVAKTDDTMAKQLDSAIEAEQGSDTQPFVEAATQTSSDLELQPPKKTGMYGTSRRFASTSKRTQTSHKPASFFDEDAEGEPSSTTTSRVAREGQRERSPKPSRTEPKRRKPASVFAEEEIEESPVSQVAVPTEVSQDASLVDIEVDIELAEPIDVEQAEPYDETLRAYREQTHTEAFSDTEGGELVDYENLPDDIVLELHTPSEKELRDRLDTLLEQQQALRQEQELQAEERTLLAKERERIQRERASAEMSIAALRDQQHVEQELFLQQQAAFEQRAKQQLEESIALTKAAKEAADESRRVAEELKRMETQKQLAQQKELEELVTSQRLRIQELEQAKQEESQRMEALAAARIRQAEAESEQMLFEERQAIEQERRLVELARLEVQEQELALEAKRKEMEEENALRVSEDLQQQQLLLQMKQEQLAKREQDVEALRARYEQQEQEISQRRAEFEKEQERVRLLEQEQEEATKQVQLARLEEERQYQQEIACRRQTLVETLQQEEEALRTNIQERMLAEEQYYREQLTQRLEEEAEQQRAESQERMRAIAKQQEAAEAEGRRRLELIHEKQRVAEQELRDMESSLQSQQQQLQDELRLVQEERERVDLAVLQRKRAEELRLEQEERRRAAEVAEQTLEKERLNEERRRALQKEELRHKQEEEQLAAEQELTFQIQREERARLGREAAEQERRTERARARTAQAKVIADWWEKTKLPPISQKVVLGGVLIAVLCIGVITVVTVKSSLGISRKVLYHTTPSSSNVYAQLPEHSAQSLSFDYGNVTLYELSKDMELAEMAPTTELLERLTEAPITEATTEAPTEAATEATTNSPPPTTAEAPPPEEPATPEPETQGPTEELPTQTFSWVDGQILTGSEVIGYIGTFGGEVSIVVETRESGTQTFGIGGSGDAGVIDAHVSFYGSVSGTTVYFYQA